MPLTADQIVSLATQIATAPNFITQGRQFLNRLLENLAQFYDFPSAAYTFNSFVIGPNAGTSTQIPLGQWYELALPPSAVLVQNGAKYLRTKGVMYQVSGSIFYLDQLPLDKYDRLFQGQGISNYPYWYVVDSTGSPNLATVQMAFYPPPNLSLSLKIRNQYQPNDITTAQFDSGTHIPWFPNQDILIHGVAEMLMRLTADVRQKEFYNQLYGVPGQDGMIGKYMKMMDDKENYAMQVKRDPLLFRSLVDLKPTKVTGFIFACGVIGLAAKFMAVLAAANLVV